MVSCWTARLLSRHLPHGSNVAQSIISPLCRILMAYYTVNSMDVETEVSMPSPGNLYGPSQWEASFTVTEDGFFAMQWEQMLWELKIAHWPKKRRRNATFSYWPPVKFFDGNEVKNAVLFHFAMTEFLSCHGLDPPSTGVLQDGMGVMDLSQFDLHTKEALIEKRRHLLEEYVACPKELNKRFSRFLPPAISAAKHSDTFSFFPPTDRVNPSTLHKIAIAFVGLVVSRPHSTVVVENVLIEAVRVINMHAVLRSVTKSMEGYVPTVFAVSHQKTIAGGKKAKFTEFYPLTTDSKARPTCEFDDVSAIIRAGVKEFIAGLALGKPYPDIKPREVPSVCPNVLPDVPSFPWDGSKAWPAFHWTNKLLDDLDWTEMAETIQIHRQTAQGQKEKNCDSFDLFLHSRRRENSDSAINRQYFLAWAASQLTPEFYSTVEKA